VIAPARNRILSGAEPKAADSFDRSAPLERTLSLVPELCRRFGITRIGETTHLDRIGIPTMCAIVPNSADVLSAYNGKGTSREAAAASAVMEAVERQIGAAPAIEVHTRSVEELGRSLDLDALGLVDEARDRQARCALGVDLFTGEPVSVPLALVVCPWRGERLLPTTHTNGLASGNTYAEAVYHALAELIERHVWSMYHVRSALVPRFYGGPNVSDEMYAELLELPCGSDAIDGLAGRVAGAGLSLRVMILRERGFPIVALSTIVERYSDPPMAHIGAGCSLTAEHAIVRSITEAVQSRVTDIQGARDVLLRPGDPLLDGHAGTRRPNAMPQNRWTLDLRAPSVRLSELDDSGTRDVMADVRCLLQMLANAGVGRVVAVELTRPDDSICVTRVVATGLETTITDGRIGPHALTLFNPFSF